MKNLLTKTLFISLLLSTVMPSDVQASLFTEGGNKFALVALGIVSGQKIGARLGSAIVARVIDDGAGLAKMLLAVEAVRVGAVGIAGIGAAVMELILGTEVKDAIGVGAGALIGTMLGIEATSGMRASLSPTSTTEAKIRIGAAVGGVVGAAIVKIGLNNLKIGAKIGAAMVKKITEKVLTFVEEVQAEQK